MIEALHKIFLFSGKERKNIYKSIFVSFLKACFSMLRIGAIYIIVTALVTGDTSPYPAIKALLLMLANILGNTVTRNVSLLQQTHAGYFMSADKRLDIANRLKRVPMGFFNDNSMGEVTGITTTILDTVENLGAMVLVMVLGGLINTIVFFLMIPILDLRIALLVLAGMVVYMSFTSIMERKTRVLSPQREKSKTRIISEVLETLHGMSVVKSFNLSGMGDGTLRKTIDEYKDKNMALEKMFIPVSMLQNIILGFFKTGIILLSVYFYLSGSMPIQTALILIIVSFQIFAEVEQTDSGLSMLRIVTGSIDQVSKAESMPLMDTDGESCVPANHDIEINNITFAYGNKEILHNTSVSIPSNTMTAFVGPSGAGKTTLALLISRFWDVNKGSITIGGKDIREYTLEALMSQISIVFQDVYLFDDTIENNIRFGCPNATRKQVEEAAKMACCHDFIASLPDGYDTVVGEGGAMLSGGEKQRISIARAILKDSPIIILDEATANVDPENEDKLKSAFEALTRNKTVIMIAHRLETIKNADRIVVINDGHAESGTHKSLMADNPIYSRFVKMREKAANWRMSEGS
ncbi:MAG: ABC transporter ATP-binding protein/permease [Lachnospiraceae bacterium]|nr:ABC transporter ATP-binding protein/permease [Lachnospiraceae bacterium]